MASLRAVAVFAASAAVAAWAAEGEHLAATLAADDACAAGDERCELSLRQLRGDQAHAAVGAHAFDASASQAQFPFEGGGGGLPPAPAPPPTTTTKDPFAGASGPGSASDLPSLDGPSAPKTPKRPAAKVAPSKPAKAAPAKEEEESGEDDPSGTSGLPDLDGPSEAKSADASSGDEEAAGKKKAKEKDSKYGPFCCQSENGEHGYADPNDIGISCYPMAKIQPDEFCDDAKRCVSDECSGTWVTGFCAYKTNGTSNICGIKLKSGYNSAIGYEYTGSTERAAQGSFCASAQDPCETSCGGTWCEYEREFKMPLR